MTDASIRATPAAANLFIHLGGKNQPDWIPATPLGTQYNFVSDVNFDVFPLNERQRESHFGRFYGATMTGIYYLNPPSPRTY